MVIVCDCVPQGSTLNDVFGMETVKADAKRTLEERFGITHSTLEIESPDAAGRHSREMIGPHH